jgi:ribonucleotide reductase beta subunit family protein with ferritin-like domain
MSKKLLMKIKLLNIKPIKISKSFCEEVYHYTREDNCVDLMVSPNHRMIARPIFRTKTKFIIKKASEFNFHGLVQHICAGKIKSNSNKSLTWLDRFKIAMQADGHINNHGFHNGKWCGYLQVGIRLTKDRKKIRLLNILKEAGLIFRTSNDKRDERELQFYVKVPLEHCTKKFKDWINLEDINYQFTVDFLEELSYWDSHRVRDGRFVYCSTDKDNIDFVQAVATLAGYKTNITITDDKRCETYKRYYRMSIFLDSDAHNGTPINKIKTQYNRDVYGFEVPSGMIVVRRNKAVSITGNCKHIEFGTKLINKIIQQDPELWRDRFVEDTISHIKQATEIEIDYARDILPRGILGLNAEMCKDYVEYLANRRLDSLGLKPLFPYHVSPFPWMSEVIELPKVDNFFEKNVIEYRSGIIDDFD